MCFRDRQHNQDITDNNDIGKVLVANNSNNKCNNYNNKSFIYTGDIYQHYTTLVLTKCPVNKIYNNIILNFISKALESAKIRLLKTVNLRNVVTLFLLVNGN